jgi:hypothetical protein
MYTKLFIPTLTEDEGLQNDIFVSWQGEKASMYIIKHHLMKTHGGVVESHAFLVLPTPKTCLWLPK